MFGIGKRVDFKIFSGVYVFSRHLLWGCYSYYLLKMVYISFFYVSYLLIIHYNFWGNWKVAFFIYLLIFFRVPSKQSDFVIVFGI